MLWHPLSTPSLTEKTAEDFSHRMPYPLIQRRKGVSAGTTNWIFAGCALWVKLFNKRIIYSPIVSMCIHILYANELTPVIISILNKLFIFIVVQCMFLW
jgi:hypothetical protein